MLGRCTLLFLLLAGCTATVPAARRRAAHGTGPGPGRRRRRLLPARPGQERRVLKLKLEPPRPPPARRTRPAGERGCGGRSPGPPSVGRVEGGVPVADQRDRVAEPMRGAARRCRHRIRSASRPPPAASRPAPVAAGPGRCRGRRWSGSCRRPARRPAARRPGGSPSRASRARGCRPVPPSWRTWSTGTPRSRARSSRAATRASTASPSCGGCSPSNMPALQVDHQESRGRTPRLVRIPLNARVGGIRSAWPG